MSFALLSGAGADFPPEMEFENAVGTGLGGLAVLFSENPVGGDDGATAFTVGLFDRSADGGLEKVGDDIPVALVASDDPVTGRVVSGPDGGFLVMIRSVEGRAPRRRRPPTSSPSTRWASRPARPRPPSTANTSSSR